MYNSIVEFQTMTYGLAHFLVYTKSCNSIYVY